MSISMSRLVTASLLGSLVSAAAASAQTPAPQPTAWEFRVTGGGLIPTGAQRNSLKDAQATAAQLSWVVRPSLAVTGTFAWARSRDVASVGTPKLDVFTSDLGVEARGAQWFADRAVTFSPFVGLGAGVRSYNYRKLDVDATNNLAGYGAIGGELGIKRVGLRLEVRDYATGFKPLVGAGKSDARNDVVVMAGLRFKKK
jgi:outer membrane protein W